MTILNVDGWIRTAKFIGTEDGSRLLWLLFLVVLINAVISYGLTLKALNRPDHMERLGWASQQITINGQPKPVYVPFFVPEPEFKELNK